MEQDWFIPLLCGPPYYDPETGTMRQRCWGIGPPAPDLPDVDLPVPGADLPDETFPETGPDVVTPGDDLTGADVESQSQADVDEDVCVEGCDGCRAALMGFPAWVAYAPANAPYHEEHTWQGYRYQAYVSGLQHDPVGGRIEEWQFVAYSWDGFEVGPCRMIEAKWGYGGLLNVTGMNMEVSPLPGRERAATATYQRLFNQAAAQLGRLSPFPEVGLVWYFENWASHIFMWSTVNAGAPFLDFDIEHRPYEA